MRYIVDTEKGFYETFQNMQDEIRMLSAPFQNPNTEMLTEELGTWESRCEYVLEELSALLTDASKRINPINL